MGKYFLSFCFLVYSLGSTAQIDLPFLPADQFEAKIDLSFRERKAEDTNTFKFSDDKERKKTLGRPIAFLAINFKLLKSNEIIKVKSIQGNQSKTQKINDKSPIHFEMGFIEDIKANDIPNELTLLFLDSQKKEMSKVVFLVSEDGTFLVNGEKRGQF
jgi:hypothetical protein